MLIKLSQFFVALAFIGAINSQDCTSQDGTFGYFLWDSCYSINNTTIIERPNEQLTGSIPLEIGYFTNLVVLNLSSNKLSGFIPSEIGNLTNLNDLYLDGNKLSGPIPPELGNMENLNQLLLNGNHLYGQIPNEICNNENLTVVLSNQNSDIITNYFCPPFPSCIETSSINESNYCDNGTDCVSDDNTDGVVLWNNCFSIENTTIINFSGDNGTNQDVLYGPIAPEIGQFLNLDTLDLSGNNLSGTIPSEITYLTNLKTLLLQNNKLAGSLPLGMGSMSHLQDLMFINNYIEGELTPEICSLSNLKSFGASNNLLSGIIPQEIGNLTNLEAISLFENNLSGPIPNELFNLTNLRMLILRTSPSLSPQGGNRFNASLAFNNIGNLANIEFLFAPACSLGGTINNEIENLQNLQFLSLMNNQLEGTVPESICNLNINFSGGGGIGGPAFNLQGNNLCPPYPECLEGSLGMLNQNISNCTSDINWSFSLSEPTFIFGGQDENWNPGETIAIEIDLCNNSEIGHMFYPGIVLETDSQLVELEYEDFWFYGIDSNSCSTAIFNATADSSITYNTSVNFIAYPEALNCENQPEYCIDGDTITFEIPIEYESVSNDNYYSIPNNYALYQNYPNPFNPFTSLRYDLPEEAFVSINIYDMLGNEVKNLVSTNQSPGFKSIQWNSTNNQGEPVSAGVYLYSIEAGNFRQTKKMILLK